MSEWTKEEWEEAILEVCIGGHESAVGFFSRHPKLGVDVAVGIQCELNRAQREIEEARKLLEPAEPPDDGRPDITEWWNQRAEWLTRNTPKE